MKQYLLPSLFLFFGMFNSCGKLNKDTSMVFTLKNLDTIVSVKNKLIIIEDSLQNAYNENNHQDVLKYLSFKSKYLVKNDNIDQALKVVFQQLDLASKERSTSRIIEAYYKLGLYHKKSNDTLRAIKYFDTCLMKSTKYFDTLYIAKANTNLGTVFHDKKKLDTAFDYYNKAVNYYTFLGDSSAVAEKLLRMANIQKSLGNYPASKATAIDGLNYIPKIRNKVDTIALQGLYHCISTSNREQKRFVEAKDYNEKALALNPGQLLLLNTKATILANLKRYPEAIEVLNNLKNDSLVKGKELARVMDNLGYNKWQWKGKSEEAEELLFDALEMRKEEKEVSGLIASNTHLANYYFEEDQPKALSFAENAYRNSKKLNNRVEILKSIALIFRLKKELGHPIPIELGIEQSNVYQYLQEVNDKTEEIYAVTKYDNDKLKDQNFALEKENINTQNQKNKYLFFLIFLILISVFVYVMLKAKHKQDKVKEVIRETTKTENRLSKKVHDELANDLADTMNFVDRCQQIPDTTRSPLVNKLENLYERTRDISTEIAGFDTTQFGKSLKFLITQHNTEGVKVITNVASGIVWSKVSDHKKINIYRSLQELLVNMKKHSKATQVTVIFKTIGSKHQITYTDNGCGVDKDELEMRGLLNMETRMHNIDGSFTFNSSKGNGFKANLYFSS